MALEFVHAKRVLHRDIKTSNVFLTNRNLVKLGDFGIARQMDDTTDFAQTCVGTPYYLSPELIEGRPYNHLSDVWALGVLLFQMMTFRYPFEAPTLPALALKIVACDHHPLPQDTPPDLRELISTRPPKSRTNPLSSWSYRGLRLFSWWSSDDASPTLLSPPERSFAVHCISRGPCEFGSSMRCVVTRGTILTVAICCRASARASSKPSSHTLSFFALRPGPCRLYSVACELDLSLPTSLSSPMRIDPNLILYDE